jgi:hypothetical protein
MTARVNFSLLKTQNLTAEVTLSPSATRIAAQLKGTVSPNFGNVFVAFTYTHVRQCCRYLMTFQKFMDGTHRAWHF